MEDLWQQFSANGKLQNSKNGAASKEGDTIGSALCVTEVVPAGGSKKIIFTLAWDNPITRFVYEKLRKKITVLGVAMLTTVVTQDSGVRMETLSQS